MDQKQVDWIDATLRDAREDWKICYFHHPLYSNAARHGSSVDLRVLLEPIFVKYGVNVVFSGHDHVYERIKPQKGIYYFVSGSARPVEKGQHGRSDQTAASFDQDLSFMVVEVAGSEMFFQAISRTGQTVDSGVIRGSRGQGNDAEAGAPVPECARLSRHGRPCTDPARRSAGEPHSRCRARRRTAAGGRMRRWRASVPVCSHSRSSTCCCCRSGRRSRWSGSTRLPRATTASPTRSRSRSTTSR